MNKKIIDTIWARQALLPSGWKNNVLIAIDPHGNIASTASDQERPVNGCFSVNGILIPGITNLHSHAHQRAMAGLAEKSCVGQDKLDSFWSWRSIMYNYLEKIQADEIHSIAAQLYLEMLQFGYTGVAEFQYLHHDPDGKPYQNRAELTLQCLQAADDVGIAFTALPVLYQYSGFGSVQATEGQKRFLNDADEFLSIVESLGCVVSESENRSLGIAPHSLRAVDEALLTDVLRQSSDIDIIHIHIAEQQKEVDDCLSWSGQRPVEWLFDRFQPDARWCLIHATHMNQKETAQLAGSGAVAGLCPTTEANLGDGLFNAADYIERHGHWGIGSDSHISISPVEELRWLEYGQRLLTQRRCVLGSQAMSSTGRNLFQQACAGGARATGRLAGKIEPGYRGDFIVIDGVHPRLYGRRGDDLIDSWLFSGNGNPVTDVFVGGRHVIRDGHHADEIQINTRFKKTVNKLGK